LALLVCALLPARAAAASDPFAGPRLEAPARTLLDAAARLPAEPEHAVQVLMEEAEFHFADDGRQTRIGYMVYRINSLSGLQEWATVGTNWDPWRDESPHIRARVLLPDGTEFVLDPADLVESKVPNDEPNIFLDRRSLRAPLPGVAVGAVVEQEIVVRERRAIFPTGLVSRYLLGNSVPVQRTRIRMEASPNTPLRIQFRGIDEPRVRRGKSDGRRTLSFELGPMRPVEPLEPNAPTDLPGWPQVVIATADSWQAVATDYARLVDARIEGSDLGGLGMGAVDDGVEVHELAAQLLRLVHQKVRYTGIEFGDNAIVPVSPAECLSRGYGDCKDKSTLLVAALRSLGIEAHLALLRIGPGEDVPPDMPGLGLFNHAIVQIPGGAADGGILWIDPSDPYARAGALPAADLERWALVAHPSSTELIRTPGPRREDNWRRELREVHLKERGFGRVIETEETWGSEERRRRWLFANTAPGTIEEGLRGYVESVYGARDLGAHEIGAPDDLSGPFRVRTEALDARRARTDGDEAQVILALGDVLGQLPKELKDPSAASERQHDFVVANPHSTRIEYRIHPPPGFRVRELPADQTQALGPAVMERTYAVAPSRVVTAVFRFDMPLSRLSPDQYRELRAGLATFYDEAAPMLVFEHIGWSLLLDGRIAEAFEEFRALAALHPDEALHQQQLALALLRVGLGTAAREAGLRATRLEAGSYMAYRTLGFVLEHDAIGRPLARGWDRQGAEAAYRAAIALDPWDTVSRMQLARVLEQGDDEQRYGPGARLDLAIRQYRAVLEREDNREAEGRLMRALGLAGRHGELESLCRGLDANPERNAFLVAAAAARRGIEDAAWEARNLEPDVERRRKLLQGAAEHLLMQRNYPASAGLMLRAAQGAERPEPVISFAQMLLGLHPHDQLELDPDDPADHLRLALRAVWFDEDGADTLLKLFAPDVAEALHRTRRSEALSAAIEAFRHGLRSSDTALGLAFDLEVASMELSVEEDGYGAYRVRPTDPGDRRGFARSLIAARRNGRLQTLAMAFNVGDLSQEALRRLERGNVDGAARLLDWARDEIDPPATADPLEGPAFARLWPASDPTDTSTVRVAAAALGVLGSSAGKSITPLRDALRKAEDPRDRLTIQAALLQAYGRTERYRDLGSLASELLEHQPDSLRAFEALTFASTQLQDLELAQSAVDLRLATRPDDPSGLRSQAELAAFRGDLGQARVLLDALGETPDGVPGDLNNAAWYALLDGQVDEAVLELARKATELGADGGAAALHTLACIYAEMGRPGPAYAAILASLEAKGSPSPDPVDWYVFGRIAESLGERDVARDYYARVQAPEQEHLEPQSTYALVQRRLAILSAQD
jgi:transglutaminase-like putative cysteine protease